MCGVMLWLCSVWVGLILESISSWGEWMVLVLRIILVDVVVC